MTNLSTQRYINLLTDWGFKRIFGRGSNKQILIGFLNSLFDNQFHIEEIEYLPTEHMGDEINDRVAIFDLLCQTSTGEKIQIELQKVKQLYFSDRVLFYSTFGIQAQAQKGDWNYKLKKTYIICVLDFIWDKDDLEVVSTKKLMDVNTHKVYTNALEIIHIEMPKFVKILEECDSLFDQWLWILKHLHENNGQLGAFNDQNIEELLKLADLNRFKPEEITEYGKAMLDEKHFKNFADCARVEGREEGREEGLNEAKVQMAKNFLAQGVDVEIVAKATGFSVDELGRL